MDLIEVLEPQRHDVPTSDGPMSNVHMRPAPSVQDPLADLLTASKGHVRQAQSVDQMLRQSTVLWSLGGPKLQATTTALGSVYWVSRDAVMNGSSLKAFAQGLVLQPRPSMEGQWVPSIKCFYEHKRKPDMIGLPRFFGLSMFGPPQKDLRCLGLPLLDPGRAIDLRPIQQQAVEQSLTMLNAWGGASITADCGFGKTRVAVAIALRLGRKTLLVCNREVLMLQWADVLKDLVPSWTVSWLQGSASLHQKSVKGFKGPLQASDVCIASIETLLESVPRDFLETFGTVIVDEAHHLAAATLVHALPLVPARYIVALSATPDRRDGLEHALYWLAGPASFVYKRLPSITGQKHSVEVVRVQHLGPVVEKIYANGQLAFAEMTTGLSQCVKRNQRLLSILQQALVLRRKIIVVSALVAHCELLYEQMQKMYPGIELAVMAGKHVDSVAAKRSSTRIVFATYSMLEEGYDDPELDTLVLATPRSRIQQTVGRIERTCAGKLRPLVYDLVDMFSVYPSMWNKRASFYKSRGFEIRM